MTTMVITGVSSFVGYHLCHCFKHVYKIMGVISRDRTTYTGVRQERLKNIGTFADLKVCDITKNESVEQLILEAQPEIFLHHAGYTQNYGSMDYDTKLADSINVSPLDIVFDSLAKAGTKKVLLTGTSMEYSDLDNPHSESEICKPSSLYGKSKLRQTLKAIELARKRNIPLAIIRIFDPFGNLEEPKKLLPYLVEQLAKKSKADLSACHQRRSFVHVEELCRIYKFILDNLNDGDAEIYNGVVEPGILLRAFIFGITEALRNDNKLLNFGARQMSETEYLNCTGDFSKLLSKGYIPRLKLNKAVRVFANNWGKSE